MNFIDNDEIEEIKGKKKPVKLDIEEVQEDIDYDDIIPEDEKIQINKVISIPSEKYQDFDIEKYKYSLNFYDFEVFRHDWCVTIINPIEKKQDSDRATNRRESKQR